ncbi:flagellar motor switch protein FliG [Shimia marina]|uniref:Flagellar motor switch protein FliG n=1 Tax=Shimia marina TaxID=321267 RepID=A0A0P1FHD8_9RHOB|nr:Flagellar motor switch protein FliG [Shimia marina]SFE76756.1 flagellar motor switch protein FliG [Shimia marina]
MSSPIPLAPFGGDADVPSLGYMRKGNLTRPQKAAIIVRFLLNEGAELSLAELSDNHQADLTYMMGDMGYIDRETLGDVLMEFAQELESIGLSFPNGISGALSVLQGQISPLTEARLRKEAGVRMIGNPWSRIKELDVPELIKMIDGESIEVSAVLISKLPVDKAAMILAKLPGDKSRRITFAMSMTENITPEAVDRIGLTLACQLEDRPPKAFKQGPEDRLGAILNNATTATRDDVLDSLDEKDAEFAGAVRRRIFTYAHIATRLKPLDVPRLVRDLDEATLITAMAYATEGDFGISTEFILNNMSARMADQLREGIGERGEVKTKEAESAMQEICTGVRELVELGEIELLTDDDDDED